ncbi:hypothetical protein LPJ71_007031, partial [Coemansia sp. S17]
RELESRSCSTPASVSSPAPTLAAELEFEPLVAGAETDIPVASFDGSGAAAYNDVFRRKWEYYFAYCEGAFATRTLGCSMLVFTRTYNEDLSNKALL